MAKTTGLAGLSEGRSDLFKIDPRKIQIKAGWNGRDMSSPENQEHVDQLAKSIAEVGVKEPITVYYEDGTAYVSDGHCRLLGAMRAIELYKAEVKTILAKADDRAANDSDRIFGQILRNSGKPFTQLEQANVFKRLIDLGWNQQDIARKAGLSNGRISQILDLLTLTEAVKNMVIAGQVSPTMAIQTVKAAPTPTAAEAALKNGWANAQAVGATKVKPAHMEGEVKVNVKAAVKEAFEYADVDDTDDEVVVVKFPVDKFEIIRKILEL